MACQTGIRANDKLKNAFNLGKQAKLRLIKVVVRNEELCPNYEFSGSADWRADWRACLPECVDAYEPCFLLFRLNTPVEWCLITFADDRAPVKEKMLLAATCATFKSEFGQCYIESEHHVTDRKELSLESFEKWLEERNKGQPLTEIEQELANAQAERARLHNTVPQQLRGVVFPLDRNAEEALRKLADGSNVFVQLSVDTLNEAIKLECVEAALSAGDVAAKIPRNKPRYTFYRYKHEHEGRPYDQTMFIYSLPSSGASIKERMLYSSCKGPFLENASLLGVEIAKKMEVDAKDDLSEPALLKELHPPPEQVAKPFARPAPPRGAPRRITKV